MPSSRILRTKLIGTLVVAAAAAQARAALITQFGTGVIRASGTSAYDYTVVNSFDAAVDAALPPNTSAVRTSLASMLAGEGLVGGPAPSTYFAGTSVALPAGFGLAAVAGDPPLNSGQAHSTAIFADLQGKVVGTHNLYYLGSAAEGSSEANRVEFAPTDVGTNADNALVLRPVSFDNKGKAIEVQPGERGVLEAGDFRFTFDPSLNIYGLKIIFLDTETHAAVNTGVYNIRVNGVGVPNVFHVPAGANDNQYFVGFAADGPLTSVDVRLGWINDTHNGGDGVVLDAAKIEFITIPEPATLVTVLAGGLALGFRRRRK